MLQLSIQDYEGKSTLIPLTEGEFTVGRDENNAICLTERNVSRNHARIVASNGHVTIDSVSATYGTRFNSLLLREKQAFKPGDVVQIGDYVLEIVGGDGRPVPRDTALVDEQAEARPAPSEVSNATAIVNLADIQSAIGPAGDATGIGDGEQPRLVVESENLRGLEFRVARTPIVLGRVSDTADLVIDHRSISKEHARLTRRPDGAWEVLDLGSANGIKVNGEPYSKSLLRSGDRLTLGHVTLRFLAAGVAAPAVQAAPRKSGGKGILIGVLALVVLLAGAAIALLVLRGGDVEKPRAEDRQTGQPEEAPAAEKAPAAVEAAPLDDSKETLKKIRKLRAKGMLQVANDAVLAYQQEHPGDAEGGVLAATIEAELKAQETLTALEGKVDSAPAQTLAAAQDLAEQLTEDSPLEARAEALQAKARAKAAADHVDQAERAIKRRHCEKAQALVEVALELAPEDADVKRVAAAAEACEDSAGGRPSRRPKTQRKPKPEPAAVAPKPAPKPKVAPKPTPAPKPAPAAAMSGKDYYTAGRRAALAGNKAEALDMFKKAVANGYGRANGKLASLYYQTGNKAACAKHGRLYLNRYPDAGDAPQIEGLIEQCK